VNVKIVRSDRRAKTVSARRVGDTIEISAPAHMSDAELQPIIERLAARLERRDQRRELDDADLAQIAQRLNQQYFDGRLRWNSLAWSARQQKRYGSCTPAEKTIRISTRLASMPRFVLEYVVMHELAHLVEANHGPRFWKLVNRYPRTERARGYLMAVGLEEGDEA
jgi:predicted metal-dependent hydrolase